MPSNLQKKRKRKHQEYIQRKLNKTSKTFVFDQPNKTQLIKYAKILKSSQENTFQECKICLRGWYDLKCNKYNVCHHCLKYVKNPSNNPFTPENLMTPCEQPMQLKSLSPVEEQLIALVHPVISIYRLKSGQFGYSGHVINFHQDIDTLSLVLQSFD